MGLAHYNFKEVDLHIYTNFAKVIVPPELEAGRDKIIELLDRINEIGFIRPQKANLFISGPLTLIAVFAGLLLSRYLGFDGNCFIGLFEVAGAVAIFAFPAMWVIAYLLPKWLDRIYQPEKIRLEQEFFQLVTQDPLAKKAWREIIRASSEIE